jgi:Na+/H+ antiporter NhaD/arsenite permease-like protein
VEVELFAGTEAHDSPTPDPESGRFDVFEKVGRLEWDTLLFFYGAMMGIGGLGFIGYLDTASQLLGKYQPRR